MSDVQIQVLSDLHLESPPAYDVFTIPPSAPHLALLGDIGNTRDSGLLEFLTIQLKAFTTVFLLLGNHEPYHSNWAQAKQKIIEFKTAISEQRRQDAAIGEFVFLDQTRYDLSPMVTILGCTLFSKILSEQTEHVSFGLNDFYHIEDWTTDQHNLAHVSDLRWLNQQVAAISATEPQRRIIILTHHSPCVDASAIDPAHSASRISSGFMTDLCREVCCASEKVKVWACGHTHFNFDFKQGEKRVLANQRGYYFKQAEGFDVKKIIQI